MGKENNNNNSLPVKSVTIIHPPTNLDLSRKTLTMSSQMTALELLKLGDQGREKPLLNKVWPELIGVALGIGSAAAINFGTRRPVFSGIQKHVLGVVGWVALLSYVQKKRDNYLAEKDAVLRHYVELHPEDFVVPERKIIGDILEPWIPIR